MVIIIIKHPLDSYDRHIIVADLFRPAKTVYPSVNLKPAFYLPGFTSLLNYR
jgi:hypothetical protein